MIDVNKFEIVGRVTEIKFEDPRDLYLKIKIFSSATGTEVNDTEEGQMYEDSIHMSLDRKEFDKRVKKLAGKLVKLEGYLRAKKEAPNSVKLEALSINEM